MSELCPRDSIDGQKIMEHWVEFQLVDEQGNPLVNMPYRLISQGEPRDERKGVTNDQGLLREESLSPDPVTLYISAQPLADEMEQRPLREKRDVNISVVKSKTKAEGHQYRYVTIGQISDGLPVIDKWKEDKPPHYHFPDPVPKGFGVPSINCRYVLEVCPFRAWVLLLHHQLDYSLVNAYNLALMGVLSYSNNNVDVAGSITHFFNRQMLDISQLPNKIEKIARSPIVYDVPFRERYTDVVFIDSKASENPLGDTELFYASNQQDIIVSWRGTASIDNAITDIMYQPLKLGCGQGGVCSGFVENGKVHKGFWEAFNLIGKLKVPGSDKSMSDKIIDLAKNRNLFVCGHSLGGALGLLHSAQLKKYHPCLYSYGMPRTLTRSAVQELEDITHYRHLNENDLVPSAPPEKDLDNWLYDYWGPLGYLFSTIELLGLTKGDEVFLHHGKIVHFYKANLIIEALKKSDSNNFIQLSDILPVDVKLYLIPSLNHETEDKMKEILEVQKEFFKRISEADRAKWFPRNDNPKLKDALSLPDHRMFKYIHYIGDRIAELVEPRKYHFYRDKERFFERTMAERSDVVPDIRQRNTLFLHMDDQLTQALIYTKQNKWGNLALKRYTDNFVLIGEDWM
ncbi:lipase family protein [Photorhabdus stackebrandtii]|uniref:Lipase n=1 Tax=Photorhabdus stackebrandtii TaxID=1123042 RepID=A0A7X5QNL7_9GAMM|nr:lipase family protein [Photorhabdus stackebrandtii]NHB97678.1 lipase [Photorhabdus stackebrandtii]